MLVLLLLCVYAYAMAPPTCCWLWSPLSLPFLASSCRSIPGPKAPAALAVFGHHGLLSGPRLPLQFHHLSPPGCCVGVCCLIRFLSFSIISATADHFMLPASICSASCFACFRKYNLAHPPLIAHQILICCYLACAPRAFCCFLVPCNRRCIHFPFWGLVTPLLSFY